MAETVSGTLKRQNLLIRYVLAGIMGRYTRCTGLLNEHDTSCCQLYFAGDVIRLRSL